MVEIKKKSLLRKFIKFLLPNNIFMLFQRISHHTFHLTKEGEVIFKKSYVILRAKIVSVLGVNFILKTGLTIFTNSCISPFLAREYKNARPHVREIAISGAFLCHYESNQFYLKITLTILTKFSTLPFSNRRRPLS